MTQMTYPSGRVVNFNYATGGGCCNSRLASVVDQTTGPGQAGQDGNRDTPKTSKHTK